MSNSHLLERRIEQMIPLVFLKCLEDPNNKTRESTDNSLTCRGCNLSPTVTIKVLSRV